MVVHLLIVRSLIAVVRGCKILPSIVQDAPGLGPGFRGSRRGERGDRYVNLLLSERET
jgi:hypothetical protein